MVFLCCTISAYFNGNSLSIIKAADDQEMNCFIISNTVISNQYIGSFNNLELITVGDNQIGYCIDKDKEIYDGDIYSQDDNETLRSPETSEIVKKILYNGFTTYKGNAITQYTDEDLAEYIATQTLIWLVQTTDINNEEAIDSLKNTFSSYIRVDSNKDFGAMIQDSIDEILNALSKTITIDKPLLYTSDNELISDVTSIPLRWNPTNSRYEVTLYDANKVIKNYQLNISDGLFYQVNDNAITFYTDNPISSGATFSGSLEFDNEQTSFVIWKNKDFYHQRLLTSTENLKNSSEFSYSLNTYDLNADVQLKKCNGDDQPLSGAVFDLYQWNGSDYEYFCTIPEISLGYYGIRSLYINSTNLGRFKIVESKAPKGYVANYSVEINCRDFVKYNKIYSYSGVVINKQINYDPRILKIDSTTKEPISEAKFGLYEWSLETNSYSYVADFVEVDKGVYGGINLVYTNSNQGKFLLKETKAAPGYINSNWEQEINITDKDIASQFTVENSKVQGVLRIHKYGDVIDSDKVTINKDGNEIILKKDHLEGAEYSIYNEKGEEIEKLTTNSSGDACSKNLEIGKYTFKETKAPKGYKIDEKEYSFEISTENSNNQTQYYIDYELSDELILGKIIIKKIDSSTNKPLAGVEFSIYNSDNTLMGMYLTNESGEVSITLPMGEYYAIETKAAKGYPTSNKRYEISIIDSSTSTITVPNTTIPKLSVNYYTKYSCIYVILAGLVLISLIGVFKFKYAKTKNEI